MTHSELKIQLDLNPDGHVNVFKNADNTTRIDVGYLFVDSENGQLDIKRKNAWKTKTKEELKIKEQKRQASLATKSDLEK